MLVASGVFMLLAAVSVVFINDKKGTATPSL
jgi:hypothetical protein